jgi:hypothetical protein
MRQERFGLDGPRPNDPNPGVSDRALAVASYAAVLVCLACLGLGLLQVRSHLVPGKDQIRLQSSAPYSR